MLNVEDLHKAFPGRRVGSPPVIALDGVDLEVDAGDFATVLGPSGSGKTTLLRCIAGFETPDRGTITLDRTILDGPGTPSVRPDRRGIGIVPQEGALFPHLTVAQNIGFGLRDLGRSERRRRIADLLDLIDLHDHERRRPHQLSGGQQQRVALARALAPGPRLILLDEPYSALDAKLRVELRREVRGLLSETGTTAVLVTHDQSEALTIADHLVAMRDGRVVAAGDPRDVYGDPADLELAVFLGDATVISGTLAADGHTVRCALGDLAVASDHGATAACRVMIRPEQLVAEPGTGAEDPDGMVGEVVASAFHGDHSMLRVRLASIGEPVPVRTRGSDHAEPGERVRITVEGAVRVYPVDRHPVPADPDAPDEPSRNSRWHP